MGEIINSHRIIVGKPKVKKLLGEIGIDGRIILKWI
jgi:hypothetical protein